MAALKDFEFAIGTEKKDETPSEKIVYIHYDELVTGKYQYRDEGKTAEELKEETINLATTIELAGRVIEAVIVRKVGKKEYEIISGHTRVRACKYLAEELGKTKFALVPCTVRIMTDKQAKRETYLGNARKLPKQAELLLELEFLREFADELFDPEEKGRVRELIAKHKNISPTVVKEYFFISDHLGDEGRKSLNEGLINKSAALELAKLEEEEQTEVLNAGITSHQEIKRYKEQKKQTRIENEKIDDIRTVEDTLPGQYKFEDTNMNIQEEFKQNKQDAIEEKKHIEILAKKDNNVKDVITAEVKSLANPENKIPFMGRNGELTSDYFIKMSDVLDIISKFL